MSKVWKTRGGPPKVTDSSHHTPAHSHPALEPWEEQSKAPVEHRGLFSKARIKPTSEAFHTGVTRASHLARFALLSDRSRPQGPSDI